MRESSATKRGSLSKRCVAAGGHVINIDGISSINTHEAPSIMRSESTFNLKYRSVTMISIDRSQSRLHDLKSHIEK